MTFNYQNCTTINASKIWITLVSIFICVKCFFWNETLDKTTTIKEFSTQN